MAGLAAAKEISVHSAGAAVLLEFDAVFTLKEEQRRALEAFLGRVLSNTAAHHGQS